MLSTTTGKKNPNRSLQCHNYSRGQCKVSHSVIIPKLEEALLQGLEQAVGNKQFTTIPQKPKKSSPSEVDYDKLISVEKKRLERAKEAYLAEIDTLEDYKRHKEAAEERIKELEQKRDKGNVSKIDVDTFAEKVMGVLEFIKREDVTPKAKNEALHTIIETMIYEKAKGNLDIYFHDI